MVGGEMRREEKSSRNDVHGVNAVVWGPAYRTHLRLHRAFERLAPIRGARRRTRTVVTTATRTVADDDARLLLTVLIILFARWRRLTFHLRGLVPCLRPAEVRREHLPPKVLIRSRDPAPVLARRARRERGVEPGAEEDARDARVGKVRPARRGRWSRAGSVVVVVVVVVAVAVVVVVVAVAVVVVVVARASFFSGRAERRRRGRRGVVRAATAVRVVVVVAAGGGGVRDASRRRARRRARRRVVGDGDRSAPPPARVRRRRFSVFVVVVVVDGVARRRARARGRSAATTEPLARGANPRRDRGEEETRAHRARAFRSAPRPVLFCI
ncbi:uncharacterized protein MICPUCDRAFT_63667 [Micromonas pusilla CCMP1545]|uniref:Predicted protein n=1 Tax=Micromonas pusilla (strain CCMP1545) TaxID=564608 RepID=C1N5I4_MICPC|nr:uncharacterized protein MICPUCDRAFT_63667 [Micromonas pusilla CCMP1545]EEH52299.1 predicted protein [Micromonas pusilla CCMP1545]|eukprot:XP_003063163.1 predicted protein [Micromonas pusilla CCMP1545]